jgi:hypothetical protein
VWRVYFLEVLASIQTGPAKKKIIWRILEPTNEWYAIAK